MRFAPYTWKEHKEIILIKNINHFGAYKTLLWRSMFRFQTIARYFMDITKVRWMAPFVAAAGAVTGYAIGGPAGAIDGAKIGFGMGVQVSVLSKTEDVVDAAGHKVDKVTDAIGKKASNAIDAVGSKADQAIEKIVQVAEKVATTWGTLILIGYIGTLALNGANISMANYNQFCKTFFESPNCAVMSLTNISFNGCAISVAGTLAYKACTVAFASMGGK